LADLLIDERMKRKQTRREALQRKREGRDFL
jgi:hypothetical protein